MKDVYDLLDEWMDKISTADGKTNQAEAANELKLLMKDKPANAILNEFANMFAYTCLLESFANTLRLQIEKKNEQVLTQSNKSERAELERDLLAAKHALLLSNQEEQVVKMVAEIVPKVIKSKGHFDSNKLKRVQHRKAFQAWLKSNDVHVRNFRSDGDEIRGTAGFLLEWNKYTTTTLKDWYKEVWPDDKLLSN